MSKHESDKHGDAPPPPFQLRYSVGAQELVPELHIHLNPPPPQTTTQHVHIPTDTNVMTRQRKYLFDKESWVAYNVYSLAFLSLVGAEEDGYKPADII